MRAAHGSAQSTPTLPVTDTGLAGKVCHQSCGFSHGLGEGSRTSMRCCFTFQFQYTSSVFIFAASFQLRITLGNNEFHKALAFLKKSKKTRQEA